MELAKLPPLQRIPLLARYARIFAAELFGTVLAVPFGLRAFSLHRSLPDARQQRAGSSVSILRNVRYGGGWVGAGCCWASVGLGAVGPLAASVSGKWAACLCNATDLQTGHPQFPEHEPVLRLAVLELPADCLRFRTFLSQPAGMAAGTAT